MKIDWSRRASDALWAPIETFKTFEQLCLWHKVWEVKIPGDRHDCNRRACFDTLRQKNVNCLYFTQHVAVSSENAIGVEITVCRHVHDFETIWVSMKRPFCVISCSQLHAPSSRAQIPPKSRTSRESRSGQLIRVHDPTNLNERRLAFQVLYR